MITRDVGSEHSRHRLTSSEEQRRQAIAAAETELQARTQERKEKFQAYNDYINQDPANLDFDTYDSVAAEATAKSLKEAYEEAQKKEEEARKKLWSAKYDTMSKQQLQEAAAQSKDEGESAYIAQLQNKKVTEERNRDLEIMSKVSDPNSVLYDPEFAKKSGYQSTMVIEGAQDELDAGYIDEDNIDRVYEFINGNENVSELTVGKERNYYKITEEEKRIYNYWYNYDREHGTNTAQQYLDLLQETLNDRDSADDYAKIEGKPLSELWYAIKSGSQYGKNINIGYIEPDGYIPRSSTEITAQKARAGLADTGDFVNINGFSLGQLAYDELEKISYKAASKYPDFITMAFGGLVGDTVGSIFAGLESKGIEYRDRLNRGYTKEQAKAFAQAKGRETAVKELLPSVLKNVLTDEEYLGARSSVFEADTKEKGLEESIEITAKAVVATRVLEKIVKKEQVGFDQVSLDLRRELQTALQDPAIRSRMEQSGEFTKEQLDSFVMQLENAGDADAGIGTYIGDYLYGENGYSINKHYLQPMVDQAIRDRGKYINDQTAKAIFERYMPRSMWGK